jgi:hypothetical protein
MREAHLDTTLPVDADGRACGALLGFDFCAEHEWGIKGIQEQFGIPEKTHALGVNRRRVRQVPKSLLWAKRGIREGILLPDRFTAAYEKDVQSFYWRILHLSKARRLKAAWDENSFIITSDQKADIRLLREVYDAIRKKDAAVGIFSPHRNPFGGAGLGLVVVSRTDAGTLKHWRDTDQEQRLLQKAKKDSGIGAMLSKAGKKYFALSPRFDNKDGSIVYWLNPFDDDKARAGWYSLQDLKDWAKGKGRVVQPDPPPPEPELEQPEEWEKENEGQEAVHA